MIDKVSSIRFERRVQMKATSLNCIVSKRRQQRGLLCSWHMAGGPGDVGVTF